MGAVFLAAGAAFPAPAAVFLSGVEVTGGWVTVGFFLASGEGLAGTDVFAGVRLAGARFAGAGAVLRGVPEAEVVDAGARSAVAAADVERRRAVDTRVVGAAGVAGRGPDLFLAGAFAAAPVLDGPTGSWLRLTVSSVRSAGCPGAVSGEPGRGSDATGS